MHTIMSSHAGWLNVILIFNVRNIQGICVFEFIVK